MQQPPMDGWKAGFPRRAGAYLMGLAIGLVVLGVVKSKLAERARANQQQAQSDSGDSPGETDPATKGD